MKQYLTKKEAAEVLKVSERTIENYAAQGFLTPLYPKGTPGKKVVFDAKEVENFFSPVPPDLVSG